MMVSNGLAPGTFWLFVSALKPHVLLAVLIRPNECNRALATPHNEADLILPIPFSSLNSQARWNIPPCMARH